MHAKIDTTFQCKVFGNTENDFRIYVYDFEALIFYQRKYITKGSNATSYVTYRFHTNSSFIYQYFIALPFSIVPVNKP
jgi:hypothetical protein